MKTNKNLLAMGIMTITIFMFSGSIKAQGPAYRGSPSDNHEQKKVGWLAAKLDGNGSSVRNGIEFYTQNAGCITKKSAPKEPIQNSSFDTHYHTLTPDMYITEQVDLVKLVNTNNYAVRVSYQESDFSPVINILVPPSSTIEGACDSKDDNLAKLLIKKLPIKADDEKQKNRIKSSLAVTKIQ
ncbi:MAG: hypothetical protein ABI388_09005 [Bacteroidia bacterium]